MDEWRETAEDCRMRAERMKDPAARRAFLQMARCYETLANQLEQHVLTPEEPVSSDRAATARP
jgi:hypothetical protein